MNVCSYCWVENNFFYEVSKKPKVAQKENTADKRKILRLSLNSKVTQHCRAIISLKLPTHFTLQISNHEPLLVVHDLTESNETVTHVLCKLSIGSCNNLT